MQLQLVPVSAKEGTSHEKNSFSKCPFFCVIRVQFQQMSFFSAPPEECNAAQDLQSHSQVIFSELNDDAIGHHVVHCAIVMETEHRQTRRETNGHGEILYHRPNECTETEKEEIRCNKGIILPQTQAGFACQTRAFISVENAPVSHLPVT